MFFYIFFACSRKDPDPEFRIRILKKISDPVLDPGGPKLKNPTDRNIGFNI